MDLFILVMGIVLRHLKARDLLTCRKVSKFWNKAASAVLRRRSTKIRNISKKKQLKELEKFLKQSSDFPFTGLQIDERWKRMAGSIEFLKIYGARFTRVRLMISTLTTRLQDTAQFINHFPRLSTLELGWCRTPLPRVESLDGDAGQEDGQILKLSTVRTIRILPTFDHSVMDDGFLEINDDVLRELFAAASTSLRIECLDATYEMLQALKRVGKLQAVSVMNLYPEDREDCALNSVSSDWPALTKLDFDIHGCASREGLMKLLVSSQHTLKELCLAGVCPSEVTSECPVLAKLTKLSVSVWRTDGYEYVFQGSHGYKFPALKELKLDGMSYSLISNLSDGLFIVPSLTTIDLDTYVDKAGIEDLAQCFPNVIEVQLRHDAYDFGRCGDRDPFDIWSVGAFKGLEKLRIRSCTVQWPTKYYNFKNFTNLEKFKTMNMDSFLTGIPITICENLRKHNQQNLMDSPFNEILRDSPSILQLKNLKELIVHVNLEQGLTELPEEPPFISMVSVWYALQMMPNLQAKFVYDYRYPVWNEEERAIEVKVVKTAFKHVRPYVELEPFFY